jgi:hypothetical protein
LRFSAVKMSIVVFWVVTLKKEEVRSSEMLATTTRCCNAEGSDRLLLTGLRTIYINSDMLIADLDLQKFYITSQFREKKLMGKRE